MSTDTSIKKQAFGVEIKMATASLKEVQDGGSISHNIIIYHIPLSSTFSLILATSPRSMTGTRMTAVLAKCCVMYRDRYIPIWK